MGIVIRQSLVTSVFSFVGVVVGYINLLWLYPLALDTDQIGLAKIIQDIAILLVPFAQIGLSQSFVKFFPKIATLEQEQKNKNIVGGFLLFMLSMAVCTYLIGLGIYFAFDDFFLSLFLENSPVVIEYFFLVLLLIFLLVLNGILEAYSRSLLKIVAPNFIKEVLIRILTGIAILLFFYQVISFDQLLYGIIIIYCIGLIVLCTYLFFLGALSLSFDWSFLKFPFFKDIIQYGLFTVIGSSSSLIVLRVDSIMVTSMLGLASYGIYTIVFSIAVVIELPRRAVTQIVTPIVAKAFQRQQIHEIATIYKKTAINQLLVGLLLFLGISVNLDNIFYFIPNGEVFEAAKAVVIIIGIGKLIDMGAGANSEIIIMSKYYRYNILFISALAIVTIIFNYILIPPYGLNGAAIASTFSLVIFNLIKYIFIKRKLHVGPFTINTLKAIMMGLLIYIILDLIPFLGNVYLDILVRSSSVTLLFVATVLLLNISQEAKGLFTQGTAYFKDVLIKGTKRKE